jgi:ABC-2 type transport system ATP-binding protein
MISLKEVSKSFYNAKAVNKLTLNIDKGEVVGFLGPNGAGKTTTMRMLTNVYSPDSGQILIDGIDVTQSDVNVKKKIGYLPENNPLYQEMLVSEYLNFIADLRELFGEARQKALNWVVDETGIKDVFYKPIGELSKGYKQRVGLAQAILHQPQILILDEPTEGLDPNQRVEIRQLIKRIGEKRTVILSTHVMREVKATCNRVLIINKGNLIADDSIEKLLTKAKGAKHIHVELEGKNLRGELEKLGHIEQITEAAAGRKKVVLSVAQDAEIRPLMFELATKQNWKLWELHQEEVSLEEIFRDLTK